LTGGKSRREGKARPASKEVPNTLIWGKPRQAQAKKEKGENQRKGRKEGGKMRLMKKKTMANSSVVYKKGAAPRNSRKIKRKKEVTQSWKEGGGGDLRYERGLLF